jgi:hypothetical protein
MAWLKELHVRSHVLVGLGRIYAEHLHELVSETATAKDLLSRAENIARYESNVREHYPEERFGAEEGGLSEESKEAALEALKKHKEQEWSRLSQTEQLEGKNAAPDDPAIAPDDKIFANVRPCILREDSSARGVDEDVQVSGALANFSDYNTKLHGNVLHESWAPRYTSMILPWTFNYMSGGPEYANWYADVPAERWRRHKDAAVLDPDRYCKNVARRAEMQFGGHWTALPIARNLAVRYQALKRAFLMVGRRRQSGMPLADSANEFLLAAKTLFERLDRGTVLVHGKKRPINGDVGLLRWADDLQQSEKELLDLYKKVASDLPGSQGIRQQFNAVTLGFRVAFGKPIFFYGDSRPQAFEAGVASHALSKERYRPAQRRRSNLSAACICWTRQTQPLCLARGRDLGASLAGDRHPISEGGHCNESSRSSFHSPALRCLCSRNTIIFIWFTHVPSLPSLQH